jgi:hypothetical protein
MGKRVETRHPAKERITMPDEVDLSSYQSLDVSFKDRKGNEVLNLQFRRDVDIAPQLIINVVGPRGHVATAITLFDLKA